MLELLKVLIETVTKALPAAGSAARQRRLNEMGAELFMLYAQLNEAMLCAEDIVQNLRAYVSRMTQHLEHGNDPYALTAGTWIRDVVQQQRFTLGRIGSTMNRLSTQLNILAPGSIARLAPLLRGKANALDSLLTVMSRGGFPMTEPSAEQLARLQELGHDDAAFDELDAVRSVLERGAVSTLQRWDEPVYREVVRYLAHERPEERVREIRALLEEIRQVLDSTFSLQDVLLKVGDRRFRTDYDGDHFSG
ncbi:hypothetical protein ACQPZQ_03750 [Pseudonocardia sp. CA-142604]|uniref:hypothetical protein n=1 Tax=Pseudonocardia sp. CA-142604 TaxID=3240024 RepID=UPI003D8A8D4A